jgi:L-seryl-tRNA(Ser) seleniumtransferase
MRALRPGRLTLAAIEEMALAYLSDAALAEGHPVFRMMACEPAALRVRAEELSGLLQERGIESVVVESAGQVGGGTLPGVALPGFACAVAAPERSARGSKRAASRLFAALLQGDPPVVGILREGRLLLDVRTIDEEEMAAAAGSVAKAVERIRKAS